MSEATSPAIHGVRIYPDSTERVPGEGASIFLHGSVSDQISDFLYIFKPIASHFADRFIVSEFCGEFSIHGTRIPQRPSLEKEYGDSLVAVDEDRQLMLLDGSKFLSWGSRFFCQQGVFLPVLEKALPLKVIAPLMTHSVGSTEELGWPLDMCALIYMWDDIYWEFFSRERKEVDDLIRVHHGDDHLSVHISDITKDHPEPRDIKLPLALPLHDSGQLKARRFSYRNQSLEFTDGFKGHDEWVALCYGEVFLAEEAFGTYLGWFKLNSRDPAYLLIDLVNENQETVGSLGFRACPSSTDGPTPVSEGELPWGKDHSPDYIEPNEIASFTRAQAAVGFVDELIANDIALAKYLLDPTIRVQNW